MTATIFGGRKHQVCHELLGYRGTMKCQEGTLSPTLPIPTLKIWKLLENACFLFLLIYCLKGKIIFH
jgi:hypothetical protein